MQTIFPSYLQKGDTIGMICPSGFMKTEKAKTCIATLQQWGYNVKVGKTLGNQFHYFSGSDDERLADLQTMLDDDEIKAVFCARGGYGISRMIDSIDFRRFRKNPKWIIGFSDITLLQAPIYSKFQVASLHAPMASAFNDGGAKNEFVQSIRNAIAGKKANYSCAAHTLNRTGKATGKLIGGNLSLLAHTIGSSSEIKTKNHILFLEDVGEYLYNVDRMMLQLKRSGKLDNLAGLIIGGFTEMKDTTVPFGQEVHDIIFDKVKEYDYPVCFDFPVSHTARNYALKIGATFQLDVKRNKIALKEL